MTEGVSKKGATPEGSKAVEQTETRRKTALDNIKNGVKPNAEELLKQREAEGKKVFKEKTKPKKESKPEFARDNIDALLSFVERCQKELGMTLEMMPVNNSVIKNEWLLKHGDNRKIIHVCPRASMRFGIYLFLNGHRDILKIHDDKETEEAFERIKARCAELDKEPEKPLKKSRGRQKSIIERLEAMEAKAKSYKDSNGFGLGNIKVTQEVTDWVEKKGYKLQSRSVKW